MNKFYQVLAGVTVVSSSIFAQAVDDEVERTYLETHLVGAMTPAEKQMAKNSVISTVDRERSFKNASWSWSPVQGRAYTYEISIPKKGGWKAGYLCANGHLLKVISPDQSTFKWSFGGLEPGQHTISLLLITNDGRRGLLEREIQR